MMTNNQNTCGCGCNCPGGRPCPCQVTPIVLPGQVRTVNRCYTYEQPVIVPCHTRVVNTFYPQVRYYPQYTTSEEDVCCGGQNVNNIQNNG